MKFYLEVCIHCERVHVATQIDQLPIPHATAMYTKGFQFLPMSWHRWIDCHIFGVHTFVYYKDFYEGRVTINGRKVLA